MAEVKLDMRAAIEHRGNHMFEVDAVGRNFLRDRFDDGKHAAFDAAGAAMDAFILVGCGF